LAISGKLWRDFTSRYQDTLLSRQLLRPLNLVDNKLDQLTPAQAMECCSRQDYEDFLSDIKLEDGKAVMISGSAGLVPGQGAKSLYRPEQLRQYAELATKSPNRFALVNLQSQEAVAVKSVNLSGGPETGSLIFIRPIYPVFRSPPFQYSTY
jgi:hypothetical protein